MKKQFVTIRKRCVVRLVIVAAVFFAACAASRDALCQTNDSHNVAAGVTVPFAQEMTVQSVSPDTLQMNPVQNLRDILGIHPETEDDRKAPLKRIRITGRNFPINDPTSAGQILVTIGKVSCGSPVILTDTEMLVTVHRSLIDNGNMPGKLQIVVSSYGEVCRTTDDAGKDISPLTLRTYRVPDGKFTVRVGAIALLTLVILGHITVCWPATIFKKRNGQVIARKRFSTGIVQMTLTDTESGKYSLARAQFVWWTAIFVFGAMVDFLGRSYARGEILMPQVGKCVYTLLISVVTLVLSQSKLLASNRKSTTEVVNSSVEPCWADLVLDEGSVALDRVQQAIWTIVSGVTYVAVLLSSYGDASTLPDIPNELIGLMGLSSAGYLGGKLVRKGQSTTEGS